VEFDRSIIYSSSCDVYKTQPTVWIAIYLYCEGEFVGIQGLGKYAPTLGLKRAALNEKN
jgi:hypothetical protein